VSAYDHDEGHPGYEGDHSEPSMKEREARAAKLSARRGDRTSLQQRQDALWRAIETLDNTLDSLSERLRPVLLPERPTPAMASIDGEPEDRSDLSAFLDHAAARVNLLGERAAELSGRVDL